MAAVIDLDAARARRRPSDSDVARHPAGIRTTPERPMPFSMVASRTQWDALARHLQAEERAFEDGAPILHVVD